AGSARHESTGAPSTSTVHVPHSPSSQPCLVPMRSRSSRRTSSSVLWTGTSSSRDSPLTVRLRRMFIGSRPSVALTSWTWLIDSEDDFKNTESIVGRQVLGRGGGGLADIRALLVWWVP